METQTGMMMATYTDNQTNGSTYFQPAAESPSGFGKGAGDAAGFGNTTGFMLYRHPRERIAGGVCGGLGDLLGIDPLLARILWVALTVMTSGAGLLAYLLLWLLLPVGTQAGGLERSGAIEFRGRRAQRLSTLLIVLGGFWLLSNLGILPALTGALVVLARLFFWPALFVAVGWLIWRGVRGAQSPAQGHVRGAGWEQATGDFASSLRELRQSLPLRRSRSNRMVLGVCGGIGQRLGLDATLVRLGWALLTLATMGAGLLLYALFALLLPEEGTEAGITPPADEAQDVPIVNLGDTAL